MEIREFQFGSAEYAESLKLRERVLRVPLGFTLFAKDTANDANEIHLGAFDEEDLVGVMILKTLSPNSVQMRQVAVEPSLQGNGVGRRLVEAFESRARSLGAKEIVMDARLVARPFYEKLGYVTTSEEYIQSTIPHFKMRKSL